jgi:UDP-glucuronate decarboxylase
MGTTGLRAAQAIVDRDVADVIETLASRWSLLSGATILVTGASGMFGGYLADIAAALNQTAVLDAPVTVYLATRRPPAAGSRLGHLIDRRDVRFLVGDDPLSPTWPATFDVVLHAASPASPVHYLDDPVGTLIANSVYLQRLLDLAKGGARAFLYVSSSEVYGNPPDEAIPTPESYVGAVDPVAPRSCYVEGKRFGEALCLAYRRQFGVPVSVIRPFHVHGPGFRLDDGRIVAALIAAALKNEPFTLSSDGTATRCYGYVADAAAGAYAALINGDGEVFNIGVDEPETSILELAQIVATIADAPSPRAATSRLPTHLQGAPARSRPDLTKARQILGYAPRVGLREGLDRTIAWHRARVSVGQ